MKCPVSLASSSRRPTFRLSAAGATRVGGAAADWGPDHDQAHKGMYSLLGCRARQLQALVRPRHPLVSGGRVRDRRQEDSQVGPDATPYGSRTPNAVLVARSGTVVCAAYHERTSRTARDS
jgi:hypothetical protein